MDCITSPPSIGLDKGFSNFFSLPDSFLPLIFFFPSNSYLILDLAS